MASEGISPREEGVILRSPVREEPWTLLGGEIRSGPGSKSGRCAYLYVPPLTGRRTVGPDPSS
jgi:hypothetical protein